jgi:hypothetical protein
MVEAAGIEPWTIVLRSGTCLPLVTWL